MKRYIRNADIVTDSGILENHDIEIKDNKITDIFPHRPFEKDGVCLDRMYISAGFIDLHCHGGGGAEFIDGTKEAIKTALDIHKNGGTAIIYPTLSATDTDTVCKALDIFEKYESDGIKIGGIHLEGPYFSYGQRGAQDPRYILKPDAEFVSDNSDVIRIITLAPEEDKDFSEIRKIKEKTDVVVSMGHTSADYDTAVASTLAGVSHATHLFNAMTPMTHRAPGVVGAALNSDVSCELIVDGYHVDKNLFDTVYNLKGRKLCFITDCLPAGGLPEGEYTLGGAKIIYRDNICRLTDGTIAGSVLHLNKGVMNVYRNSNIPLHECVNCASLNPATVIGLADRKGSLEVGKDADIVLLDGEFNVKKTIIGGRVKYEA